MQKVINVNSLKVPVNALCCKESQTRQPNLPHSVTVEYESAGGKGAREICNLV